MKSFKKNKITNGQYLIITGLLTALILVIGLVSGSNGTFLSAFGHKILASELLYASTTSNDNYNHELIYNANYKLTESKSNISLTDNFVELQYFNPLEISGGGDNYPLIKNRTFVGENETLLTPNIGNLSAMQNESAEDLNGENADEALPIIPKTDSNFGILLEGEMPIKAITVSAKPEDAEKYKGVYLNNQTQYNIDLDVLIGNIPSIKIDDISKPTVLVIHTHTTEAYTPEGKVGYDPTNPDIRTTDLSKNVAAVGDVFVKTLKAAGIGVLHDKEIHDYPSFNGAYSSALKSINGYLEKYPSIEIVIDIHRDSMINNEGIQYKVVKEINGKSAAQIMIVTGTDECGLYHPDWKQNLRFSSMYQMNMEKKFKGIMRYINLRISRFNTHATHGSVILEIGSCANTLDEAKYAAELAAEGLIETIALLRS